MLHRVHYSTNVLPKIPYELSIIKCQINSSMSKIIISIDSQVIMQLTNNSGINQSSSGFLRVSDKHSCHTLINSVKISVTIIIITPKMTYLIDLYISQM